MKKEKGITLVALVITIVVLLILVGITITYIIGDNSVLMKAQEAKLQTEIAQAREKLEMTLSSAQIPKQTKPEYNENDFLNEYILGEIREAEIIEDIVIVNGYAFEIDRSVPKIGEYIGKKDELVFPEVIISEPVLAADFKSATFTITTKEEKNGISKVQIIQENDVLQEYTYDNKKDEIIIDFIAKQNGKYKVKVYSKLAVSKEVTVNGIVMAVEYTPSGNEEYKKEHQVKVTVKEITDKVKSMKYQWTNTTIEPQVSTFIENCNNNAIITGKGFTGTYYLWILLETESGKTNICRSEGFNFDNEGPNVTVTSMPVSETSFTLTVTASDMYSSLDKCEFYVEGVLKETKDILEASTDYTVVEVDTGDTNCYVIVTDSLGNETKQTIIAKTKLYTWSSYTVTTRYIAKWTQQARRTVTLKRGVGYFAYGNDFTINVSSERSFIYTNFSKLL